jgi:hypothetical protein
MKTIFFYSSQETIALYEERLSVADGQPGLPASKEPPRVRKPHLHFKRIINLLQKLIMRLSGIRSSIYKRN